EALRQARRGLQIIFQDPFSSLDPRQKVGDAVARGPMAYGTSRTDAMAQARQLLARVGLTPSAADRYPHEFSGGQRQRICIARALALRPKVLIAAEIADRVIVLQHGRIVEEGPTAAVFTNPREAYTRDLLDAIPGRRFFEQPSFARQREVLA